ncbi:MAG: DUF5000 domain-containing lipoprotein [Adhaeribacter sp.]
MKRILFLLTACTWACLVYSCKEEEREGFFDANAPAPGQVEEVQVTERPGGALITYKIPADPNFAYAKAVYETRPGVFREAKASRFTDTLALVGYGDTLMHEVQIFSVGKNEKASSPLSLNVRPRKSPVESVFGTINLKATFGGVQVSLLNPGKASLAIELMVENTEQKTWTTVNTFYTAAPIANFAARGFDVTERKFAVYLRDRWSNKSDTLIKMLTPRFETAIPKDNWKALVLPTDQTEVVSGYSLVNLWNDKWATLGGNQSYASANASTLPQWFTLDLGKKVMISRFKMHQAPSSHLYVGSAVKIFELYGSNAPDPDGGWSQWTKMGTFTSFKPSGLPLGQTTAEDLQYGSFLGEDFFFDIAPPAFRYIRWKTLETYSSTGQVVISELSLWGEIQD